MTPLEAAAVALFESFTSKSSDGYSRFFPTFDALVQASTVEGVDGGAAYALRRLERKARAAISAYLKACAEDASAVARVRAAIKAPGEPDIDTDVAWYESRVHAVLAALEPKE